MEDLSPESRALYDLLKADTHEEYERRFLEHKKDILDAVRKFVDDTTKELKRVNADLVTARSEASKELEATRTAISSDLAKVNSSLSSEIASIAAAVERIPRPDPGAEAFRTSRPTPGDASGGGAGPTGHCSNFLHRGTTCDFHMSPPGRGNDSARPNCSSSSQLNFHSNHTDTPFHGPRVELPSFDGANPKLWQRRCEEYFQRWQTPANLQASYASSLFTGAAATWLEAYLEQQSGSTWQEFAAAVLVRFGRNQHQLLVRKLFHISQTSTVEDYVQRFSELVDQIAAYESKPDPLHYTTRFLDGLQPGVRVLVAIQQPRSLDEAYTLALLYEELGDGCTMINSQPPSPTNQRRVQALSPLPPAPPSKWISRSVEEKRAAEQQRGSREDQWARLREYRRAKGLCFTCGEKWSREHVCKGSVQLHVVQEMIDYLQTGDSSTEDETEPETSVPQQQQHQQFMLLSAAALQADAVVPRTMQLQIQVQGHSMLVLVDSGSSSCFIDTQKARQLQGAQPLPLPIPVKVAGGAILESTTYFPSLSWTAGEATFSDTFRVLDLASYDGIIGLDWLGKHSPMVTHWEEKWIAIQYCGRQVVLHGEGSETCNQAVVQLHLLQENVKTASVIPPDVQAILDEFKDVFATPTGLPPRRQYDHKIPLVPGARPVSVRPYRVAPELKTEIEKQIAELLEQGVITHSSSAFGSPVLLVRKSDRTWRLVIDFRRLNALTIKGKFPLPVIDELLDELAGAQWFSKLDLKAGYHQIRLAPGEEHKTAFQTHAGHYEFKVMAFGLTGAPATFQHAMNASLASVLRQFALVFFDDILVYSRTYEDHLQHLKSVLSILQKDQWQVKLSKCDFAQQRVTYLGHVISADGVATDDTKIQTIRAWPIPQTLKELRGFLGITGYYRKFIKHYAILSQPLTALLKKGAIFTWTPDTHTAFQVLKNALITAPVLALPDFAQQFVIDTDACDVGIGAVLSQKGHPVAFVSRALGPRNRGLSVYEKEYLAILLAIQQWRSYLQLGEFVIRTDHKSLTHLSDQRLHTDWQQKALTKMMGLQYVIQYKKGVNNGAADALSRKPPSSSQLFALTTVQPAWLEAVVASYEGDDRAQELLQQLALHQSPDSGFTLNKGVLRCKGRIWIGQNIPLQQQIIAAFHDSPQGGHSGFPVTYRRISSLFSWASMKSMIREYVRCCQVCQQAKPERLPPAGLLQPLPVPSEPWDVATMDFISGLPTSRQFDCILVVVDKLTKYAHFIPLKHPFTASKVAELFVDNIYRLHGMPNALISDRDPIFTSIFWQAVFRATGTQLKMSTANHPETDGQTERVNQSLECYLRCFISGHPQHWAKWLSLCEFWYNTNWHSSLGKSPFELLYGRQPRYFGVTASSCIASTDVQEWLDERRLVLASVRQHLLRMQQRMKDQADKHRIERTFAVGDAVFLRLQPYLQSTIARRANHKLAFKFFGPFQVLERIGEVAYRLDLPPSSRVHPVFHVSQLKQCISSSTQVSPLLPSPDPLFQVPERILQRRLRHHGGATSVQALIKWTGMSDELATWEDLELLRRQFPQAPAWGQAGLQGEGIVSGLDPQASTDSVNDDQAEEPEEFRPKRSKRKPAWLTNGPWVT